MKVLFAVGNESVSESIVKKYQKDYKQIISYKNVYYFNAILKEIQKDKTYDRIIISEDLEAFSNNQFDQIDGFIFEKLDSISDEAITARGVDTPIILICSDRRKKSEDMLIKIFGIGIYDALIGADRNVEEICKLVNKPRTKKEAKSYYQIDAKDSAESISYPGEVSEIEIQNILAYFGKIGNDIDKIVASFNNIASQYDNSQLRIICRVLPLNVRAVLEEKSSKYQEVMAFNQRVSDTIRIDKPTSKKQISEIELVSKNKSVKLNSPVVIPNSVNLRSNVKLGSGNTVYKPQPKKKPVTNYIDEETDGDNDDGLDEILENLEVIESLQSSKPSNNHKSVKTEKIETKKVESKKAEIKKGETKRDETKKVETKTKTNNEHREMKAPRTPKISDEDLNDLLADFKDIDEKKTKKAEKAEKVVKTEKTEKTEKAEKKSEDKNSAEELVKPVKRGRGRPRKNPLPDPNDNKPKRGRGRPRKNPIPEGQEHLDLGEIKVSNSNTKTSLPGGDSLKAAIANSPALGLVGDDEISDDDLDILPGLDFNDDDDVVVKDSGASNNEEDDLDVLPGLDLLDLDEGDSDDLDDLDEDFDNEELNKIDENSDDEFNLLPGFDDDEYDENSSLNEVKIGNDINTDNFDSVNNINNVNNVNIGMNSNNMNINTDINSNSTGNFNAMNNSYDSSYSVNGTGNLSSEFGMNSSYLREEENIEELDLSDLLVPGKKIVSFVGTSKNGTSFIVNNLAILLAKRGIDVAILDTTRNKNSYYIYTENDTDLRNIASKSINDLSNGIANGIKVENNLTVYTSIPGDDENIKYADRNLQTLLRNHSLILIDTDFSTSYRYFQQSQETYLVQTQDVLTIQPLTAFLRELKAKNALDEKKLRIVLNKVVNIRGVTEKTIVGGMAFYNDPAMSYMTELFDRDLIKYISIPFEEGVFAHYLENIIDCRITLKGYSKGFMQIFNKLGDMVYSTASVKNQAYIPPSANKFSNNMNNTLEQMRKNY